MQNLPSTPSANARPHATGHSRPDFIGAGSRAFFVERPEGERAEVVVATSGDGEYLKADDEDGQDTMLALPEPPG